MKRTKLMLSTLILGLGMAGAAWAQPAPNHDRDVAVNRSYRADRDNANRGQQWRGDDDDRRGYNPYVYQRGDGDHDRDDRGANAGWRDNDGWRNQRDSRSGWNWGRSNMRRGRIFDK